MRLEYLSEGSPDCPLLRLYDFSPPEAQQLYRVLRALTRGALIESTIHQLPFVEPVGGCRLTCHIATSTTLIRSVGNNAWGFSASAETWK